MNREAVHPDAPTGRSRYAVVGIYLAVGLLWILFSDQVLSWLVPSSAQATAQTLKGWFYVLATGALLYWLLSRYDAMIDRGQATLRDSRDRLDRLVETVSDGITIVDRDGRISFANAAAERLLGLTRDTITERDHNDPAWRITDADGQPVADDQLPFSRVMRTGQAVIAAEHAVERPDGERILISINAAPLRDRSGACAGMVASLTDVTERRRISEALRESQRKLLTLMGNLPGMAYSCRNDAQWTMEFVSQGCQELTGYRPIDLVGNRRKSYADLIAVEDRQKVWEDVQAALADRRHFDLLYRIHDAAGTQKWVLERGVGVFTPDGELQALEGFVSDITELKQAQVALEAEKRKAQNYLDVAAVILLVIDSNHDIALVNRKGCEILGYTQDELLGRDWFDLCLPDTVRRGVRDVFGDLMAGKVELHTYHENPVLTKSGEQRLIAWRNALLTDEAGKPVAVLSSGEDITERRRAEQDNSKLEEQLRLSQKMEAVGKLAGGIAHDFNNLLTGVLGHASLLKQQIAPGEPAYESAEVIEQAANRGAELTSQLLGFARGVKKQDVPVDLKDVVGEVMRLLGRTLPGTITIRDQATDAPTIVRGDPGQLQQVVLNLALNARDAMPEGGELRFDLRVAELDDLYCRSHADVTPGHYVVLAVTDNGAGIPEKVRSRVFEPFFSTKADAGGAGMGLAMAYGIVRNHGGAIGLYSEVGRGTTFRIYLPAAQAADAAPQARRAPELTHGVGRILVVDDEEVVRRVASQMLERLGYKVATVDDGQAAVDYYQEHGAEIDLVIVDLVMPRMGGPECFRALREIDPDVRAVLSTAYGMDDVAQGMMADGLAGFVQKPYRLEELSQVVADAMKP